VTPSKIFAESLYAERGLRWITRAHVRKVEPGRAQYETLDGEERDVPFDFAMLLPPFAGVGLKAFDRQGSDITSRLFMPNGFLKVDADYAPKPYEQWRAADWPRTYQSPEYRNLFAAGIAFAPPPPDLAAETEPEGHTHHAGAAADRHAVGHDRQVVARSIVDMMRGADRPPHRVEWPRWAPPAWRRPGPTRSPGPPRR